MILRMFHGENIVFLTCRAAVFRRKVGLTVVLRWSYDGPMIQVTEKYLELSTYKGTKKVRETSDIVRVANGKHEGHEDKMHMKLDDKSQQITQITQIIIDKRKSSNETNETNKRNHRIRRNAQKYIMVQERDKKKVSVSFCVVCG